MCVMAVWDDRGAVHVQRVGDFRTRKNIYPMSLVCIDDEDSPWIPRNNLVIDVRAAVKSKGTAEVFAAGGILADEMGSGKTIAIDGWIACNLKQTEGERRADDPYLIILPDDEMVKQWSGTNAAGEFPNQKAPLFQHQPFILYVAISYRSGPF